MPLLGEWDSEAPDGTYIKPQIRVLEKKDIDRRFDPVVITGEAIPELLGKDISSLRLASFIDGELRIILHQFDERDKNGAIIIDNVEEGLPEESVGILDAQDELVFKSVDMGDRVRYFKRPLILSHFIELTLTDPLTGEKGWCYLQAYKKEPPPLDLPSDVKLISDPNDGQPFITETNYWKLTGMTNKIGKKTFFSLMPKDGYFMYGKGKSSKDVMDRFMLRIKLSFLFGKLNIDLNESSMTGGLESLKVGPVRAVCRNWSRSVLPLGVKGPTIWSDVFMYEHVSYQLASIKVPFNPGYVITMARGTVGIDWNPNAYGMKFYNSENLSGFDVDGRMSEAEQNFDPAPDQWRCLTGQQGTIVMQVKWDESIKAQADSFSTRYLDDQNTSMSPDDNKGAVAFCPTVLDISSVDPGTYYFYLAYLLTQSDAYLKGLPPSREIEGFLNIQKNPLQITINQRTVINDATSFQSLF